MTVKILRLGHDATDLRRKAAKTWNADQARRLLALVSTAETKCAG